MTLNPEEFWKPYETTVASFDEAHKLITTVFREWSSAGSIFAWRGHVNASWGLHSSLYRRLHWTKGAGSAAPDEEALQLEEKAILREFHRWGLHTGASGRLPILSQLAVLQHYGAPTRILDITLNPLIGLWFATEQQWENGAGKNDDKDGRLFAIDISKRLINEDDDRRGWEDSLRRPWPRPTEDMRGWTTTTSAWRPSRLDHRISAQNGGFLIGGVPGSSGPNGPVQWLKDSGVPGVYWSIDEVRQCLSIPVRFHKIDPNRGRDPSNPAYTIRIKHDAKPDIRKHLEELFGYRHSTIYPDYPGFALYGRPGLKSRP